MDIITKLKQNIVRSPQPGQSTGEKTGSPPSSNNQRPHLGAPPNLPSTEKTVVPR